MRTNNDIQKAKDGIGREPRPGGEILAHPVKIAVDDGVSVKDHQFHKAASRKLNSNAGHLKGQLCGLTFSI